MCGRYDLSETGADLMARFGITGVPFDYQTNPDFRPTQYGPVIYLAPDGKRDVMMAKWGLVPFWSKTGNEGAKYINARAETIDTAGPYKAAFRHRRCLVPAGAFYEWTGKAGAKLKHRISLASGKPLTFAGLWERWKGPDGVELFSYAIVTCAPNEQAAAVHDRMPVILDPETHDHWLHNPDKAVLVPYAGLLVIDPPAPLTPLGPLL